MNELSKIKRVVQKFKADAPHEVMLILDGRRARVGNNVSKAKNRTKRMFYPNLHVKKFYIPEEDKWITIKVCSSALKSINKDGISAVLKKAKEKGTLSI